MDRKAFINDHLIDMRDRFRKNYKKMHASENLPKEQQEPAADAADSGNSAGDAENKEDAVLHTVQNSEVWTDVDAAEKYEAAEQSGDLENNEDLPNGHTKYLPSVMHGGNSALSRERRELEGMVIHDISATDSECALLENKLEELKKFNAVLKEMYGDLMDLSERSEEDVKKISEIRNVYFSASGRWKSFSERHQSIPYAESNADNPSDRSGGLLISGAILAASIILAMVMIGLFS